jgi:hypothetical protein
MAETVVPSLECAAAVFEGEINGGVNVTMLTFDCFDILKHFRRVPETRCCRGTVGYIPGSVVCLTRRLVGRDQFATTQRRLRERDGCARVEVEVGVPLLLLLLLSVGRFGVC